MADVWLLYVYTVQQSYANPSSSACTAAGKLARELGVSTSAKTDQSSRAPVNVLLIKQTSSAVALRSWSYAPSVPVNHAGSDKACL